MILNWQSAALVWGGLLFTKIGNDLLGRLQRLHKFDG